jgi:hypothetical protein
LIDAESRLSPAMGVAVAPGSDPSEPHPKTSRRSDDTANHLRP